MTHKGDVVPLFKPNVEKMKRKGDVKGLVRAVDQEDRGMRMAAIEALGELRDKSAVPGLLKLLDCDIDRDRLVDSRWVQQDIAVMNALGNIGGSYAVEHLMAYFTSALTRNRGDFRGTEYPPLYELLKASGHALARQNVDVWRVIGELVLEERLGIRTAMFFVEEALSGLPAPSDPWSGSWRAATTRDWRQLVGLGEVAVQAASAMLSLADAQSVAAARVLGKVGGDAARAVLSREGLRSAHPDTREMSARALAHLGGASRTVDQLLAEWLLDEGSVRVVLEPQVLMELVTHPSRLCRDILTSWGSVVVEPLSALVPAATPDQKHVIAYVIAAIGTPAAEAVLRTLLEDRGIRQTVLEEILEGKHRRGRAVMEAVLEEFGEVVRPPPPASEQVWVIRLPLPSASPVDRIVMGSWVPYFSQASIGIVLHVFTTESGAQAFANVLGQGSPEAAPRGEIDGVVARLNGVLRTKGIGVEAQWISEDPTIDAASHEVHWSNPTRC